MTIKRQIIASDRLAFLRWGTKLQDPTEFSYDSDIKREPYLSFRVRRVPATGPRSGQVKVILNGKDLYDVEFWKFGNITTPPKMTKRITDVFSDALVDTIDSILDDR